MTETSKFRETEIATITRLEVKVDYIINELDDLKKKDFIKRSDFAFLFDENMKRHAKENLQYRTGWSNLINNCIKIVIVIAGAFISFAGLNQLLK